MELQEATVTPPGSTDPLTARLQRIETRQERIEELLEEIVDKLNDLSRDYGPGYAVEG